MGLCVDSVYYLFTEALILKQNGNKGLYVCQLRIHDYIAYVLNKIIKEVWHSTFFAECLPF